MTRPVPRLNGVKRLQVINLQKNLRFKLKLNYSLGVVHQNEWANKQWIKILSNIQMTYQYKQMNKIHKLWTKDSRRQCSKWKLLTNSK